MTNTNKNRKDTKVPKKTEKEEKLDKVIAVSSEEVYYINRDIEAAINNSKTTSEEIEKLELQKGITVFTTIGNAIEKVGEKLERTEENGSEKSKKEKTNRFVKNAFEILRGSISNTINNKDRAKTKENLLNHFKKEDYKNIELTVGGEKKKLWEFVDENFDSMCNSFENICGKNIPNAEDLKKMNDLRTVDSYFTNGLTERVLNSLCKATSEEEFCKKAKEEYEKAQKEIKENKKLTANNTKTGVQCALGFGAAGLAVAFPPLIFISALLLLFNAKDGRGNNFLPGGNIVSSAIDLTKKAINTLDQDIKGEVNKYRNEKEKKNKEEYDEVVNNIKKHSEEIRKSLGQITKDNNINEMIKNLNINKNETDFMKKVLGITNHYIFNETINSRESLEKTTEEINNSKSNIAMNF